MKQNFAERKSRLDVSEKHVRLGFQLFLMLFIAFKYMFIQYVSL